MAEEKDKKQSPDKKKEQHDLPPMEADRESEEELNATMMAIDLKELDLEADTKTEIKVSQLSDTEIIEKQLEEKRSPIVKFLHKLARLKKEKKEKAQRRELPVIFKKYLNLWFCEPGLAAREQIRFYVMRAVILALSVWLHSQIIHQVFAVVHADHPARAPLMTGVGVELVLALLILVLRFSPGWIVTLPLGFLSLAFAYTAHAFHTADPLLFRLGDLRLSGFLNLFYLVVYLYGAFVSIFLVAQRWISRVFFAVLFFMAVAPIVLNFYLGVPLEFGFFGVGFLTALPAVFLQPLYLLFNGLTPLLVLVFLILSFGASRSPQARAARGFSRSLAALLLLLLPSQLALMQKNRVPHVLNFIFPMKLDVGAVELEVFKQNLRVETKNFKKLGGGDGWPRYRMSLKKAGERNQFLLKVVDEFDFPVKNLSKDDFVVYSDGQPVSNFRLFEERAINYRTGNYVLEVALAAKEPLLTWDKKKTTWQTSENIVFSLGAVSKIKRFIVKRGDVTLMEVLRPKEATQELPLHYFDSGSYRITVQMFDELEQEIHQEKFNLDVVVTPDLLILTPLEGDTVGETLQTVVVPLGMQESGIESMQFAVDDRIILETAGFSFYNNLDVSALAPGAHKLTVTLKRRAGDLNKSVGFFIAAGAPRLQITQPTIGAFAKPQTEFHYRLEDGGAGIAGIKVFVNGRAFGDFTVKDDSFKLPVIRWAQSELYVAIQATLRDGTNVSDWVQLNKGIGTLSVHFDTKSLGFLNYKSIAVILDATISNLDSWQGKEKWKQIRKLVTDSRVSDKIKDLNPSFFVTGSQRPNYYHDCTDVETLIKPGDYTQALLKKELMDLEPLGVSGLYVALKKAYRERPEKIFVFADSSDACHPKLVGALGPVLEKLPNTEVVIFVLGRIQDTDAEELKKLAKVTRGKFYQPDNYETLLKSFINELVLRYELYSQNELIKREPLGSQRFQLVPGAYILRIPYGTKFAEQKFTVKNGLTTTVEISGEKNEIHIRERTTENK